MTEERKRGNVGEGKKREEGQKGNREKVWICAVTTKHRVCACGWVCAGGICGMYVMCVCSGSCVPLCMRMLRPGLCIIPRMLFKYQSPGNSVFLDCSIYQLWTKSLM